MSQLFAYKLLFIIELLIAEALFCYNCQRRKHFIIRLIFSLSTCIILTFFYPLPKQFAYTGWYTSLMFLVLFCYTIFPLSFSFNINFKTVFFIGVTAYTVQHLSYQLVSLISNLLPFEAMFGQYSSEVIDFSKFNGFTLIYVLIYLSIYITIYGFASLLMSKKMKKSGEIEFNRLSFFFLSTLILLVDIILNAFTVYESNSNNIYPLLLGIYNIICCIFVFYIQLSAIKVADIKTESEIIAAMLRAKTNEYQMQKENINLINQKCHDIKYMLRNMVNNEDDKKQLNEIVNIYDNFYQTGNDALNTILTDKSLLCSKNNIQLTCMIDENALSFMKEVDIYCLFGNLLDNAIEASSKLKSEEKTISLNIALKNEFTSISLSNYFDEIIEFDENGLPITSKKDKGYHGFGMKSIDSIIKNYGGNISIVIDKNIFRINILLPKSIK